MLNLKRKRGKGSILIIAILTLGVILSGGSFFLSFSLAGSKMSWGYEVSAQTYYLAEAGVAEAIFKLKNDPTWKDAFETMPTFDDPNCLSWSIEPYQRSGGLFENGSYTITITNLGCAKAEIISEAKIQLLSGGIAQRVVKTKVFKAIGNPISDFAVFTGGPSENIDISSTNPLNIYNGSLFSNNNLKIKDGSIVNVAQKALAHGNIIIQDSQLTATTCSANLCDSGCATSTECPPEKVSMPPIGLSSYLSEAEEDDCSLIRTDGKTNCFFSVEEFEKLMWDHYPELSLPTSTVIYINGDINIRAGQELTVNGVLAANRDINIGENFCWTRQEFPYLRCGFSQLIVQRPGTPTDNIPAGILAERKINTGGFLGLGLQSLDITGLVYAGDEMRLSSIVAPIEIHGGIAVRKLSLSSLWSGVDIYLDPDVIVDTFIEVEYSPVITIDYWEEEY